jgi:hypothetical protein
VGAGLLALGTVMLAGGALVAAMRRRRVPAQRS